MSLKRWFVVSIVANVALMALFAVREFGEPAADRALVSQRPAMALRRRTMPSLLRFRR